MTMQSPATDLPLKSLDAPAYRRFALWLLPALVLGIAGFGVLLWSLARADRLPPPPLTADACIDEKFKFLAEHDIRDVDFIAVGSSVTWRNLDMSAFQHKGLAQRPLNAAPCYLHIGETAYYTEFLLGHMKKVKTVLSVVSPRDFEQCSGPKDGFFSATLANAYVFDGLSPFPIYLTNFRPVDFFKQALQIKGMRTDPDYYFTMMMDKYGSGPLHKRYSWLPEPLFQNMCFSALTELEKLVNAAGDKLVVTDFPLQPEWRAKYDPRGDVVRSFEARIRAALKMPSTLFLRGTEMASDSLVHADSVHYLWESAVEYSARLADRIATVQPAPVHRAEH
jgi:hypothetical protein